MKTILFFVLAIGLTITTSKDIPSRTKSISGKVTDVDDQPLLGVNVFIKGSKKGTVTDSMGEFSLVIPTEFDSLTISFDGYASQDVKIDNKESLQVSLQRGTSKTKITEGPSDRESSVRLKGYPPMLKKKGEVFSEAPVIVSPTSFDSRAYDDSVPMESSAKYERTESKEAESVDYAGIKDKSINTSAGQLTAGEWNDLNNWEAWNDLVKNDDYREMEQYWGVASSDRVTVFVSNQYELPIADCVVTLTSDGKIVWTSKTDNAGKAEIWVTDGQENLEIFVQSKKNKQKISNVRRIKDGVNIVQFKEECNAPRKAEIMFVVDATGSMGDEIEFLKSELRDVIDQVEASRSDVDFEWGSVFYRDGSDEYLTRQSPLTSKTKKVLDFINMQSAGGGGDYPEAVNEGLEEALLQEWSEDAIARIVFLVLDAPPHHDPEVLKDLQSQIAFASAMGIKIIPITASGINRQTEYLMKFMSVMTNGTYVFLTDHSGIGNAHLDPVTKDFEVEKLNDLLVRVIGNYTDPGTCVSQEDNDPIFAAVEVFPNPTTDMLRVKVPDGVRKVTLTSSSGMLIHSEKVSDSMNLELDLSSYIDGMYVINFFSDDKVYSVKVVKSNKA